MSKKDQKQLGIKMVDDNLGKMLFKDEASKDFTIVGGGAKVKCHKLILQARSTLFPAMLQKAEMTGEVTLEGISEWGVNQLVRFLYGMEIPQPEITPNKALELLRIGYSYGFDELVKGVARFILERSKAWFENQVDEMLQIYVFAKRLKIDKKFKLGLGDHLEEILDDVPVKSLRSSQSFHNLNQEEKSDLIFNLLEMKEARIFLLEHLRDD